MNQKELIREAFTGIYPEKKFPYLAELRYSGHFRDYNASVELRGARLSFKLSKKWQESDEEIVKGLLQELMAKILKKRLGKAKSTINREFYNNFIKKLHLVIPKTRINPVLRESFERVNKRYFNDLLGISNLVWGQKSTTKLGSYNYQTDTISISTVFKKNQELLDYVMYHEMLHKKYQYKSSGERTIHHSSEFKLMERSFEKAEELEKELTGFLRKARRESSKNKFSGSREQLFQWKREAGEEEKKARKKGREEMKKKGGWWERILRV